MITSKLTNRIAVVGAVVALAGCKVGPDYQQPELTVPGTFSTGEAGTHEDLAEWWTTFGDAELDRLVRTALENGNDLRMAHARVSEARAARDVSAGRRSPRFDLKGSSQRVGESKETERFSETDSREHGEHAYGIDSSWELDFWGRVRRMNESARAAEEASVEDLRNAQVVLAAEVASAYIDLREAQTLVEVARRNFQAQQDTFELVRRRNEAGITSALDVHQAELNLARTESEIPNLKADLYAARRRLETLAGVSSGEFAATLDLSATVPAAPSAVFVDTPADVIRRRPDIRAAERRLAAQSARIGVATADLYPRFTLLGSFGFEAFRPERLFTGSAGTFGIGPKVRWNIFDAGRIRGVVRIEDARTEQALIAYEHTILRAIEEVETSATDFGREIERQDAFQRAVHAAAGAANLAREQYESGVTDFQNVLDMQRIQLEQDSRLAASRARAARQIVRLYKALGGGWSSDDDDEDE